MAKRKSPKTTPSTSKKATAKKAPSIYEPLPEGEFIRVLVLQPGNYDDDIVCHLEIQSHDSPRRYSAISYVWGDPDDTVSVSCNGLTHPITVNLANALRHFRSPRKVKRLWADALCIDQANDVEKSHQVTYMGKVYENATCVLVWLGLDVDGVAEGCFRLIERINKHLGEQLVQNEHSWYGLPSLKESQIVPTDPEGWLIIERLMRCSWFKRVWAVQECSLAVRCRMFWGSANIDIADVVEISIWCREHDDIRAVLSAFDSDYFDRPGLMFVNAYCYFRRVQTWQLSRSSLRKRFDEFPSSCLTIILTSQSQLRASNERDYVYAFLGCIYAKDNIGPSRLKVDYTASIDRVYYEVAKVLLSSPSEGPWVLSAVTRSSRRRILSPQHPTWIPQWNYSTHMLADRANSFEAGGSPERYTAHIANKSYLHVSGFVFDRIIWKSVELSGDDFLLQPQQREYSVDNTKEPYLDRLWRAVASAALDFGLRLSYRDFTLTLQYNHRGYGTSTHDKDMRAYRKVASLLLKSQAPFNGEGWTEKEHRAAFRVSQQLYRRAGGREMFLTKSGRIGLGTVTEVGDSCCIVMGATVPFIFAPGNEDRYRLVEEAYIHGVMDGELLDEFEPTTIKIE